jgi:8-oxo-dGTP pyrophosphatase MutT (NUDIX family)
MTDQATQLEERLRAAGDWLGASCVARWGDRGFVFAGRVEEPRLILSGIGGKVEPGETFRTAVLREFLEETGCRLGPLVAAPPRHLTADAARHPVPDGAAALVAERPPTHPAGGTLWIAVFLALVTEAPRPVEKIEVFVVVPPSSGWPRLPELRMQQLAVVVVGDDVVPAGRVLPATVTAIGAEHTAAAVLSSPGLLCEWWEASG